MIRRLVLCLAMVFGATAAAAFDVSDMSANEEAAFRSAIRDYLLDNPEVIFEAVEVFEQRQASLQITDDLGLIAANSTAIFNDGRSFVGGNHDGDITIVEFLDYRCGYCKRAFSEVKELISSDGNIRFVIKEFPILGEESTLAARFAIAVRLSAGVEAYALAHDELMLLRGSVNTAALNRIAAQIGVDFSTIEAEMGSAAVDQEIQENYALAQTLGISGTPSFVFQSEMLRGYVPLDGMRSIVERIRG